MAYQEETVGDLVWKAMQAYLRKTKPTYNRELVANMGRLEISDIIKTITHLLSLQNIIGLLLTDFFPHEPCAVGLDLCPLGYRIPALESELRNILLGKLKVDVEIGFSCLLHEERQLIPDDFSMDHRPIWIFIQCKM